MDLMGIHPGAVHRKMNELSRLHRNGVRDHRPSLIACITVMALTEVYRVSDMQNKVVTRE